MSKDKDQVTLEPTPEFRVSYPNLFKPSAIKGSDKLMYSVEMLFDKSTTDLSVLQAPLKAAIIAKWGPDKEDWPSPLQMPIRDGDKPKMDKKLKKAIVREEHKGMWVVKASSSAEYERPILVGKNPKIKLENESELYPGCYARASIKAFAYDFADKFGVKFILNAVQFVKDGPALGSRKKGEDIFGAIEGDSGDIDLTQNQGDFETEENFI